MLASWGVWGRGRQELPREMKAGSRISLAQNKNIQDIVPATKFTPAITCISLANPVMNPQKCG